MDCKKIYEGDSFTIDTLVQWYCEYYSIEVWRTIPGFDGLYEASTLGRIRSLNYRKEPSRIEVLKLCVTNDGYKRVNLYKHNKQKSYWVHILVAKTFLPNPFNLPQINHKDENPSNNAIFNLEWCTPKHNCNWGTRNTRQGITQKANASNNKRYFATLQLTKDGELIKEWVSANEAANTLGINVSNIVRCCNHKPNYKTAGGYKWEYSTNLLCAENPG